MYTDFMRTTLTLEEDVAARLAALQRRTGQSFKDVVNQTLRAGLERQSGKRAAPRPRFKVIARKLGLRPGLNYANVGELLEQIEGPAHR
jgi:hypothetical protein